MEKCPICRDVLERKERAPGDRERISCPQCGEFEISRTLAATISSQLNDHIKVTKMSHAVRGMHETQEIPYLDSYSVDKILEKELPSPKEQADLLIRWLGNNNRYVGESERMSFHHDASVIGATKKEGFQLVVEYLKKKDLIQDSGSMNDSWNITLSMDGWEYFDKLKHGEIANRKAFMAMKYGDKLLDTMYKDVFKKAVDDAGFELYTSIENPEMGLIDNKMRIEIQNAAFVVVDLTHDNSGAYWEAGYAEGLGKDVIYTCEAKKFDEMKTHFDTNHHLTIPWDEEEPDKACEELKASIRATLPHLAKMED